MIRKLLDVAFWLALSAYFGGLLMLAVAAPVIFSTAQSKENPIVMKTITSPALDPSLQAGGEIFGAVLLRFAVVEGAALVVLAAVLILWHIKIRLPRPGTGLLALGWLVLAGLTLYNDMWLTPRVFYVRDQVRTTATQRADSKGDWPEKAKFDALHVESTGLAEVKLLVLLGMVGIAAWRGSSAKPRPLPPAPSPAPAPVKSK